MRAGQKMYDNEGRQVALFPLVSFVISQSDTGTYSHGGGQVYWATDYLGYNERGTRQLRAPCYAPVDLKLLWFDPSYPVAVWESLTEVHMPYGIDYLTVLTYHDNDVANGLYHVGDIKRQGEIFNRTGTMNHGSQVGDHMHLETGRGRYNLSYSTGPGTPEYKYHITDYTTVKRLHNYNALYINDTIPRHTTYYPTEYPWVTYQGGSPIPPSDDKKKYRFKWVLYANKLRQRDNIV